ncbi:MAG: hypothetical protein ACKVN9_07575 [Methylophilaceae bacterium]
MSLSHAEIRMQQRGIPPFIDQLLDLYGREQYDGHGAVTLFLDRKSIRCMERDMGREPVRQLSKWLNAYKVKRCHDGSTVTVGHRCQKIWRK